MSDWTSGYVADIGYTFGYYNDLNPMRVPFQSAIAMSTPPKIRTACELGFGQGISINMHAAASDVEWYGTDFNPSQAGFAQSLAKVSGAACHVYDQSFDEFCSRQDLPDFDYIGLHGIWSWISDENRGVIVDFVRRKLNVGGVLYISYNTMPGWAGMLPVREIMTQHADVMGVQGVGITKRIDGALEFLEGMFATKPAFLRHYPQAADRVKLIKGQNRNYVAHEYFNRDWKPMSFAELSKWVSPAKLNYVCSSHYQDSVDAVNFSPDQQKFMAGIPDAAFRESVRDFMLNTQFRRDYWVRGARALSVIDRVEILRGTRLLLVTPRANVELKITGNLGEATLNENVYKPILDLMADHQVRSIGQIEQTLREKPLTLVQVIQACQLLLAKGNLMQIQAEEPSQKVRAACRNLNRHIARLSRSTNEITHLASPMLGGGVPVARFHQMMLAELAADAAPKQVTSELSLSVPRSPDAGVLGQRVWRLIEAQNQRLIKDGKALQTPEENIAELTEQAREFLTVQLPILRTLGVEA